MGLPRATAFRFGQGHSQAVFNVYFQAGETKNVRAKSTRWSVWQPCFWGCDMTLRAPPAASKSSQTTKAKKNDTNHPCAALGEPKSIYRSHVLTTFLGPVLGAMMKQVCWHSPCHCFLMLALLRPSREQDRTVGSKAPPAVAKSTPKAAKLRCAFSHSAERIVDELGLLYPENRGNLRKNMASV